MASLYKQLKPIIIALGIAFMATWSACGGAGGGGSGAAPSGGGDSPVAVEIPAINSASDLVYMTGPVITGTSGSVAAKSLKSVEKDIFKNISMGSDFTGNDVNACQTTNITRGLLNSAANADAELCFLTDYIIPPLTAQGTDIYNRNVDVAAYVSRSGGVSKLLLRFNIQRDSDNAITDFKMYICDGASQIQFTHEAFSADGTSVVIDGKEVETGYSATNHVTGQLSSARYTSKDVEQSSRQEDSGVRTQSSTMAQTSTTAQVAGFSRNAALTTQDVRISSGFGFLYGGVLTDPLDLTLFYMTNGKGRVITNVFITASGDDGVNDVDTDNCWDSDGDTDASACGSYESGTPPVVVSVPAATFDADQTIDCSVLVAEDAAGTLESTYGSASDPLVIENSTCSGFAELDNHMDCYDLIYGGFTVTPTISGAVPSTNSGSPTVLGTTTPTLILTTNFPAYQASFIPQLVMLSAPAPFQGNVLGDSDFTSSNWSGGGTILTLHPTLVSGRIYTLTLGGDLAGLNQSSISDQPAPQQSTVFYMTP